MFELISYGISCSVGTYISLNFLSNMFNAKYKIKFLNLFIGMPFAFFWYCINLANIPFLNFIYFIVIYLIIEKLFYVVHEKEIFKTFIFILFYACCDIVISSLFKIIFYNYNKNSYLFLIDVIIIQCILICIYKILITYLKDLGSSCLHKKQILFLFTFPIINIATLYLISIIANSYWNKEKIEIVILLMGIITTILNLITIYFFDYVSRTNTLENNLDLIKQKTSLQYDYYKDLEIEYDNMQYIIHDIKHHINVINKLYATDPKAGANYSKKVNDTLEYYTPKFKCKNSILNIIVNEKIKTCEEKNITFHYSIENTDIHFMDDIDITSLFANLLDNAIEACKKMQQKNKCVDLRVYKFNKMLVINVINTMEKRPLKVNDEFISSKPDHKAIGLKNVKLIVEKYDGDINIETEQCKFSVSIIFPVPS